MQIHTKTSVIELAWSLCIYISEIWVEFFLLQVHRLIKSREFLLIKYNFPESSASRNTAYYIECQDFMIDQLENNYVALSLFSGELYIYSAEDIFASDQFIFYFRP